MVVAGEHLSGCCKAGSDSALDRRGQAGIDIIACEEQILPTRLRPGSASQLLGAGNKRGPPFLDDSRRWNGISRQLKRHGGVRPEQLAQLLGGPVDEPVRRAHRDRQRLPLAKDPNRSARRTAPKRISAPCARNLASAGSTNVSESPSFGTSGRQAAPPRPSVSARIRQNKRADAPSALVFNAATASGSHNRRNSGRSRSRTSATVAAGSARRNATAAR